MQKIMINESGSLCTSSVFPIPHFILKNLESNEEIEIEEKGDWVFPFLWVWMFFFYENKKVNKFTDREGGEESSKKRG